MSQNKYKVQINNTFFPITGRNMENALAKAMNYYLNSSPNIPDKLNEEKESFQITCTRYQEGG